MFILIDKEQMCVRYKNRTQAYLTNLMHIELSHVAGCVIACDWPGAFAEFSDLELKLLYQNLCGQKYEGYSREVLVQTVQKLCMSLEESKLNGFEISLQAGSITEKDEGFYKYLPGSNIPQKLEDAYTPTALVTVPGCIPVVTTPPIASVQPLATPVRPRAPSEAPAEQPKVGSKTGRVWELAEAVWQKAGCPTNIKEIRKQIIEACEAEGINSSTASVQFGKWRSTKSS